jgi:hypothetical protein
MWEDMDLEPRPDGEDGDSKRVSQKSADEARPLGGDEDDDIPF